MCLQLSTCCLPLWDLLLRAFSRTARCLPWLTCLLSLLGSGLAQADECSVAVPGQVFCDDFQDGRLLDSAPRSWFPAFGPETLVRAESESLALSGTNAAGASIGGPSSDVIFEGTSLRTQVRLRDGPVVGAAVRWNDIEDISYFTFLSEDEVGIGLGGNIVILERKPVDFNVAETDVLIQLDAFDDEISLWAWPADEPMPSEPTLTAPGVGVSEGRFFLWTSYNDDTPAPVAADFRFVQLATQSIHYQRPIGDCNSDGVLDSTDLNCVSNLPERDAVLNALDALPGDLDGDGVVGFEDFVVLSMNYGGTSDSYVHGNVDLRNGVDFADFIALSANYGKTVERTVSVPEPCGNVPFLLATFTFLRAVRPRVGKERSRLI